MSVGTAGGGAGRRPLLARTALPSLLLLLLSAWLSGCERGDYRGGDSETTSGGGGGNGGSSAGSSNLIGLGIAGTGGGIVLTPVSPRCVLPDTSTPVFADRAFSNDVPARRELYTWTTPEQVQEIRAGSVLFTRTERDELGPGYAMTVLKLLSAGVDTSDTGALAALLSGPGFEKARYAWSEPWATRVGWPGETYGDQLVRMLLRPDAWLARYHSGSIDVVDMDNAPVAAADALAHPERLAGVYFVRGSNDGGPICGGSFQGGGDGYREFIIGNESMIEEWSLSTPEIAARIESDITLVQAFFDRVRPCPPQGDPHSWNLNVVCAWGRAPAATELGAYEGALAMPSPNYLPQAAQLAALIDALQASRFDPDPLVVKPGQ